MNRYTRTHDDTAIQSRLAARLAAGLSARAAVLPPDVTERLRFAREQALSKAREARQAAPVRGATVVGITAGGAAALSGFVPWWQRAASMLPLAVLVAGLLLIDRATVHEQVVAAAEFDAQLLSDNLPPSAYSDPGFAEYLRSAPAAAP